jgi:hypothetical protein
MGRSRSSLHATSPSGLVLVDDECSASYLSATRAFVTPAARVTSVLRIARAGAWITVKALFVVVAVPLILIFVVASFGVIFARGGW